MKKILVTTDFSDKSKAGLLFAIQLAKQNKYVLTFFHAYRRGVYRSLKCHTSIIE